MNDSQELVSSPNFDSDAKEMQKQHEDLRKLFLAALVAMLLISASLTAFLGRQVIFAGKELDAARPQVKQLVANYQQVEEPQINIFVNTLINYARTHPDFNPILAKYKIAPAAQTPVAPTGVPTTPAKK